MSTCTLSLAGACATSLSDVAKFITDLKDLDLKGESNLKCCGDGTSVSKGTTTAAGVTVTEPCACPSDVAASKAQYACVFDACMTWGQLTTWLTTLKAAWNNFDFAPAFIAIWTAVFGFFGAVGPTQALSDALPIFYTTSGGLVAIIAGVMGGIYASYNTIQAAVKVDFTGTALGVGTNFLQYGGNGWAGDALGVVEMLWVLTYISLACYIVWTPFSVAWEMDKAFRADQSNNKSFDNMFAGLVTAVGAWGASVALQKSTDKLIGFFDVQRTDVGSYYQTQTSKQAEWGNFVPIIVDLTHHGLTLATYWALAGAMSYGSYRYAFNYITNPGQSFSLM